MVQDHPDLGTAYGHAGVLAAAEAVWADLEEHGILDVLLERKQGASGPTGAGAADRGARLLPHTHAWRNCGPL